MKKQVIKYIIVIVIIIVYFLSLQHYRDGILKEVLLEFPRITISENIKGVITKIEHIDKFGFRNDPHQAFIIVDGFIKKDLHVSFEKHTNLVLDDILNTGDSILKEENSTTIVITNKIKQTEKYYFKLNYK